jgi:hypothetical protein
MSEHADPYETIRTLEIRLGGAESALRAIAGPTDAPPWIVPYRDAGGGYEGLQAIAASALSSLEKSRSRDKGSPPALLTDEALAASGFDRPNHLSAGRAKLETFLRYHATEGREALTRAVEDAIRDAPKTPWGPAEAVVTALVGERDA